MYTPGVLDYHRRRDRIEAMRDTLHRNGPPVPDRLTIELSLLPDSIRAQYRTVEGVYKHSARLGFGGTCVGVHWG